MDEGNVASLIAQYTPLNEVGYVITCSFTVYYCLGKEVCCVSSSSGCPWSCLGL